MILLSLARISARKWKAHIGTSEHEALCGIKKGQEGVSLIPGIIEEPTCIRCCTIWNQTHPKSEWVKVPDRKLKQPDLMAV